jgi:transcriptional regulator with XRE-family HTH domain
MSAADVIPEDMSLSVLLFYTAMNRNISVSAFADEIDIGAISLRQFIHGKTRRPRTQTLNLISAALGLSADEARRRLDIAVESRPEFGVWLQKRMKGHFSRAKLGQTVKISDGAMRNYINGSSLPDAHQAARIADVLGVPYLEVAEILVANQVEQNGGVTVEPQSAAVQPVAESSPTPAEPLPEWVNPKTAEPVLAATASIDEEHLLGLWRRLHPQARRATQLYIAGLLAES